MFSTDCSSGSWSPRLCGKTVPPCGLERNRFFLFCFNGGSLAVPPPSTRGPFPWSTTSFHIAVPPPSTRGAFPCSTSTLHTVVPPPSTRGGPPAVPPPSTRGPFPWSTSSLHTGRSPCSTSSLHTAVPPPSTGGGLSAQLPGPATPVGGPSDPSDHRPDYRQQH